MIPGLYSQGNCTLTGVITDSESKEGIANTGIYIQELAIGTEGDENGVYTLEIPVRNTSYVVDFYALSYKETPKLIECTSATTITKNISLVIDELGTVVIDGKKKEAIADEAFMVTGDIIQS